MRPSGSVSSRTKEYATCLAASDGRAYSAHPTGVRVWRVCDGRRRSVGSSSSHSGRPPLELACVLRCAHMHSTHARRAPSGWELAVPSPLHLHLLPTTRPAYMRMPMHMSA